MSVDILYHSIGNYCKYVNTCFPTKIFLNDVEDTMYKWGFVHNSWQWRDRFGQDLWGKSGERRGVAAEEVKAY